MFYKCRVVKMNPESCSCDIVDMDSGRRWGGVQVLSSMVGGNVGSINLPEPTVSESGNTGVRDIYCLVAFVSRDIPVVVGFLSPKISQMLFKAKNFKIDRHASDFYTTITETGDVEIAHPSGSFVRIAETLPHVDLTATDYDQRWAIKNNVASTPGMRVQIGNGGSAKVTVDLTKEGHIHITNVGNTQITTTGTTILNSTGEVSITAPNVVIDATVHIKKAVTVDADVTANGISLTHHVHSDPQGSNTGQPV